VVVAVVDGILVWYCCSLLVVVVEDKLSYEVGERVMAAFSVLLRCS
jgi:hypothetical protein